jgi:hypothetical protein
MATADSSDPSSSTSSKVPSGINESVLSQLQILRALVNISGDSEGTTKHIDIDEISRSSRLSDSKETQRYLFILEGQKFVAPFPEGDLTSRRWCITASGRQAVKQFKGV